jgi:hypothetical protein
MSRRPEPMIALKLHCVPNIPEFQHSNRTTLSFDSEALEGRLSTGWGEAPSWGLHPDQFQPTNPLNYHTVALYYDQTIAYVVHIAKSFSIFTWRYNIWNIENFIFG